MRIIFIGFLCGFFLLWIVESSNAVTWINDFSGNNFGGNWSLTDITALATHTAEATTFAGNINTAGGGRYSTAVKNDANSVWSGYGGQYFSLYVYGDNSGNNLTIELVEEDEVGGIAVDETWTTAVSAPITINWTGWRYEMFQLPGGVSPEFTKTGATGDNTWNPG